MEWLEYQDSFVARRECIKRIPDKYIFEVKDIIPGVTAAIIEPKKRGGRYRLGELIFEKPEFSADDAFDFWDDFQVDCVETKKSLNKKFGKIAFAAADDGIMVLGIYRDSSRHFKKTLKEQIRLLDEDYDPMEQVR